MQPEIQSYKDRVVWKRAMDLAPRVHRLCKSLPVEEKFALADQLRRASVSVAANIAEGQGRSGAREFAHFLGIARGSLAELDTLLILAFRFEYLSSPDLKEFSAQIAEIRRPLFGLIRTLNQQQARPSIP